MPYFTHLLVRVLRKTHLLSYINFRVQALIGDKTFVLPIHGNAGFPNPQLSEPWLLRALKATIEWKSGAFVDVGVNAGQTLLKYAAAGGSGPYYGFDPSATAAAYVKDMIRLNRLHWAQVVPVGLSNHTGCARLHLSSELDAAASIVADFRPNTFYKRSEIVAVFRGDDIISAMETGPISIVKIDVEGGELEVLQGLEGTIEAHRPLIFCEILPIYDLNSEPRRHRRSRTNAVEALLRRHNYQILRLLRDCRTQELKGIETHGDRSLCDYLFYPTEAAQLVGARLQEHSATD
jgi:FkbM family methyltransferase